MTRSRIVALVLAAGKGTRMHSDRPKVLHELLGEPMLAFVYEALDPLCPGAVLTVTGFGADQVEKAFPERAKDFVLQAEQLGTGHALRCAWERVSASGKEFCLVVNGDTPLLHTEALKRFLDQAQGADLAFATITPEHPGSFGRVVRDKSGEVAAIVEAKDLDPALHGDPREVNAGVYVLRLAAIGPLLAKLTNANQSGEYYITDLIALAKAAGLSVRGVECGNDTNLMGVNSPLELTEAEEHLRARTARMWLARGVMIHRPGQAVIGPRVHLEPGSCLHGPCELYGTTRLARGAVVESHCVLLNAEIAENARVRSFSHLEQARVGGSCVVGPYARLRPGAVLLEKAKVGNFVEVKKSVLGKGAKASHLTYLGDAEIGPDVNVGAGTITCNFDGLNKFKTIIKAGAFIGSNTALVAPVTVGENALVGAGSVITKDVPDGELAVARGRQVNLARKKSS
jgi:bifunctional UDP-N-acetylglucosamine pyrophosphorylase/glucosamine-1-phosphate N-acetyltransferase